MTKAARIMELEFTVEDLECEIEGLRDTIADMQRRIVELITENDRLTLVYEPYEPPREKLRIIRKWWK